MLPSPTGFFTAANAIDRSVPASAALHEVAGQADQIVVVHWSVAADPRIAIAGAASKYLDSAAAENGVHHLPHDTPMRLLNN